MFPNLYNHHIIIVITKWFDQTHAGMFYPIPEGIQDTHQDIQDGYNQSILDEQKNILHLLWECWQSQKHTSYSQYGKQAPVGISLFYQE